MRRFLLRFALAVVIWSAAAALVWWTAWHLMQPKMVTIAKVIHELIGWPAPYLNASEFRHTWHVPIFPPLVGLVMASSWLSWPRRGVALLMGLFGLCVFTALQITLDCSPYLPDTALRMYIKRILVAPTLILPQVVLWLIVTGGPRFDVEKNRVVKTRHPTVWSYLGLAAFCLAMGLLIPVARLSDPPANAEHRAAAAKYLREQNPIAAVEEFFALLQLEPGNGRVAYTLLRLGQQAGLLDPTLKELPRDERTGKPIVQLKMPPRSKPIESPATPRR